MYPSGVIAGIGLGAVGYDDSTAARYLGITALAAAIVVTGAAFVVKPLSIQAATCKPYSRLEWVAIGGLLVAVPAGVTVGRTDGAYKAVGVAAIGVLAVVVCVTWFLADAERPTASPERGPIG